MVDGTLAVSLQFLKQDTAPTVKSATINTPGHITDHRLTTVFHLIHTERPIRADLWYCGDEPYQASIYGHSYPKLIFLYLHIHLM